MKDASALDSSLATAIRELRKKILGLNQSQMAQILNVSLSTVAKWETSQVKPTNMAIHAITALVPEDRREWWKQQTGSEKTTAPRLGTVTLVPSSISIPLLKQPSEVGGLGKLSSEQVELNISLPREWFPDGGMIRAARVSGTSMKPIIDSGCVVLIDVSRRDPDRLVNHMVAVTNSGGISVKWLRRDGDVYLLTPQTVSTDDPVKVLRHEGEGSIVGQVVKWLGDAPSQQKTRARKAN